MVTYYDVQYPEKNYDPILRKFSDGQKNRRTDGQTN